MGVEPEGPIDNKGIRSKALSTCPSVLKSDQRSGLKQSVVKQSLKGLRKNESVGQLFLIRLPTIVTKKKDLQGYLPSGFGGPFSLEKDFKSL
jgi:hypothetical protein